MLLKSKLRALLLIAAFALALVAAAKPADAATGKPCWLHVIDEWADGDIAATHAPSCYTEAIKHLPTDVSLYTNADTAIRSALLTALRSGPASKFTDANKNAAADKANAGTVARTLADVSRGSAAATGAVADVAGSATSAPTPLLLALVFAGAVAATGAFRWRRKRRDALRRAR